MRVLMFQAAARDQLSGVDQGLDDSVVGVALVALISDYAFPGEARCLIGEEAVAIDRVGDRGVDAQARKFASVRHPDVEIITTVTGRSVHEACANVVGDVITNEHRHWKFITVVKVSKRMNTNHIVEFSSMNSTTYLESTNPSTRSQFLDQFLRISYDKPSSMLY